MGRTGVVLLFALLAFPALVAPNINPNSSKNANTEAQTRASPCEEKDISVRVARLDDGRIIVAKGPWDYLYIGGSLLLTIVTLLIAISGIRQAGAANAAVEAQIKGTRPWLHIKDVEEPYLTPLAEVRPPEGKFTHCMFSVHNAGKTPARIVGTQAQLWIGDKLNQPPAAFKFQTDPDVTVKDAYLFPPEDTKTTEAKLNPVGIITPQERDEIVQGGKFLWLCGVIKYYDTYDRKNAPEYETRFCYRYETRTNAPKPFWMMAGPLEYNRAS